MTKSRAKLNASSARTPGIRARLALLLMSAVVLALGAGGVLVVQERTDALFDDALERASTLMRTLAIPCAMALARHEPERLDGYLAEVANSGNAYLPIQKAGLLDYEGRWVAVIGAGRLFDESSQMAPLEDPATTKFLSEARQSRVGLWRRSRNSLGALQLDVSMPAVSGLRWGTLYASFSLEAVEAAIDDTRELLIVVGLAFVLFILAGLTLGLSRMVVRPLDQLRDAAIRIEAGDLSTRLTIKATDEMGRFSQSFNAMAEKLEAYTGDLEKTVSARTREVATKNTQLADVNAQLALAVKELKALATTDALTGLANRRSFTQRLEDEVRRGARQERPFALAIIDVDHFKQVNDRYGHLSGDEVLHQTAHVLSQNLRNTDFLARLGGDEFAALLLDVNAHEAFGVIEKLQFAVANHVIAKAAFKTQVTVSIGMASFPEHARDTESLIARADEALYAAKGAGRNQGRVYDPAMNNDETPSDESAS